MNPASRKSLACQRGDQGAEGGRDLHVLAAGVRWRGVGERGEHQGGNLAAVLRGEGPLFPKSLEAERELLAADLADLETGNALRILPAVPCAPANHLLDDVGLERRVTRIPELL